MTPRDNLALLTDRQLDAGRGDKTAYILDDDREVSFAELHRATCRVANRLQQLGVHREERVLLVLDDTLAFPAAFLGAIRMGAVPVPVNFLARAEDMAYFLSDSRARVVIVDELLLDKVASAVEDADDVALVVANGTAPAGAHALEHWLEQGVDHLDVVDSHPEDPAFWLYSSGSTGRPKGVIHLQHDAVDTCIGFADGVLGLRADDIGFSTTKLFHAYGLGNGLTFPLWAGTTQVMMAGRPDPGVALERIDRHRPTILYSVPTLFNAMLAHPRIDEVDLSSLRANTSAAEALPPEVWRRWHERTGTEILDGIGSTEMLHIYCANRPGEVIPGSSGRPVPGYELQLRDEDGRPLDPDAPGEGDLFVKGPSALAGYWHRQDKTRQCVQGEWFLSGDRYRRDVDGVYWYEGRTDDMMKVGGLWVSPVDIENRLMEHEAVVETAVVAAEVDGLTRIHAVVIPREGVGADDQLVADLQTWCKDALQRYQFPHIVDFVDDLPRTATGKIQRFKLRA